MADTPKTPLGKTADNKEVGEKPNTSKAPLGKTADNKEVGEKPDTSKAPLGKTADNKEVGEKPDTSKTPLGKTADNKEVGEKPGTSKNPPDKKAKIVDFKPKPKGKEAGAKVADTKLPTDKKDPVKTDKVSLAEQKKKLEAELREKYGIPKTDKFVEPWVAPEQETVVRIPHEKLHAFKDHPFNVEKNAKYMAFVSSIIAQGVTQPVIVRPDQKGDFEIISGHRRDTASIDANIPYTPCIVRALNDEQAIQQMVEDNVNNREIGTMELARALKMQLDAIKKQGVKNAIAQQDFTADVPKRSNEIIAGLQGLEPRTNRL